MGWQNRLLLLAFFGVLGIMAGKGMVDADSERVHKLPNDERLKRSGEHDGGEEKGAEGTGGNKMGNPKEKLIEADIGGGDGDGETGSTVEPGGDAGSGNVFKKAKDGDNDGTGEDKPVKTPEGDEQDGGKSGGQGGGQNNPDGGQNNPNGGQNNPNGGQNNPNGGQNNPNGGQNNPNGGQNNPNGGQNNPNGDSKDKPNGDGKDKPNGQQVPPVPSVDPPSPPAPSGDQEKFDPLHANFFAYYDSKTGQCYYGKTMKDAKENKQLANGKILVHDEKALPVCVADFDQVSKIRSCGLPKYDQMVYCIKVQFYGEGGIEGKTKGLKSAKDFMESNKPKTLEQYKEHYMQNKIFVFVDGCIRCKDGGKYTVQFYQIHPVGPIEKICPAEEEMLNGGMEKTIGKEGSANYLTGSMLKERLCISREKISDEAKMDLTYKYNAKMVVKHNCGGGEGTHTILFGTTIEKEKINYNVFHLRNVQINLDGKKGETNETIRWDWKEKKTGLGYFYYEPKNAQENVVMSDGSISFGEQDMEKEMNMDLPDLQLF